MYVRKNAMILKIRGDVELIQGSILVASPQAVLRTVHRCYGLRPTPVVVREFLIRIISPQRSGTTARSELTACRVRSPRHLDSI
jgi:hypothetical protein